tara:strand:- start:1545 stop:2447 length:903 start_codon:yes stop_codon:yes gene_type:complete
LTESGSQKKQKILLLGPNGQLGESLKNHLGKFHDLECADKKKFDFLNPANFSDILKKSKPSLVINAAAYTNVEGAESNENLANQINGEALKYISSACETLDLTLLHFSTDYVFDGNKNMPYHEDDKPNPISIYGNSKLLGEKIISNNMKNYMIFRTSGVISKNTNNFINKIMLAAETQKELRIVDDQVTSLNHSNFIAEAIYKILSSVKTERVNSLGEIYNLVGPSSGTWFEFSKFAQKICRHRKKKSKFADISIIPVTSEEMSFKANRPKYSHLSSDKIEKEFSLTIPSWEKSILEIFE